MCHKASLVVSSRKPRFCPHSGYHECSWGVWWTGPQDTRSRGSHRNHSPIPGPSLLLQSGTEEIEEGLTLLPIFTALEAWTDCSTSKQTYFYHWTIVFQAYKYDKIWYCMLNLKHICQNEETIKHNQACFSHIPSPQVIILGPLLQSWEHHGMLQFHCHSHHHPYQLYPVFRAARN